MIKRTITNDNYPAKTIFKVIKSNNNNMEDAVVFIRLVLVDEKGLQLYLKNGKLIKTFKDRYLIASFMSFKVSTFDWFIKNIIIEYYNKN